MEEHREYRRAAVAEQKAPLCRDQEGNELMLADLSLGGVGLRSNAAYPRGSSVKVELENTIQFEIEVKHCVPAETPWRFRIGGIYAQTTLRPQTLNRILSLYLS